MLCIGYGQFIPVLLSEATVTIFSMVTGATFYALFIAHSMAYIIQRDASKSSYQEKVSYTKQSIHGGEQREKQSLLFHRNVNSTTFVWLTLNYATNLF